ncbi:MAG: hypothetical protein KKF48_02515 [Nanoarchaeota archaeon]|nr:hypothetical protein [Nanoarchaeota archaeon]MBU1027894.1 hypothetical protein [Nanoarchaeota archaeon]
MGAEKYLKQIESLFSKSPVVSYSSIQRIVNHKKSVKGYAKRLVFELIKRGKVKRLTKGYYTKLNNSSLAVFCFQPAYLGLQDALSFHNFWEQETIPIIITTKKIRQGIRKVLGTNVLIRRIKKKYLFGIEYNQEGKIVLPYSDIEKTFIDMVYYNENINQEVIKEIRKRINRKKLKLYLKKYPKKIYNLINKKYNII